MNTVVCWRKLPLFFSLRFNGWTWTIKWICDLELDTSSIHHPLTCSICTSAERLRFTHAKWYAHWMGICWVYTESRQHRMSIHEAFRAFMRFSLNLMEGKHYSLRVKGAHEKDTWRAEEEKRVENFCAPFRRGCSNMTRVCGTLTFTLLSRSHLTQQWAAVDKSEKSTFSHSSSSVDRSDAIISVMFLFCYVARASTRNVIKKL